MRTEKINVKVINKSKNKLPEYETENSAGLDLRADVPDLGFGLAPGERKLIPTGLYLSIPEGYEGQVRPRSGLALKKGITVLNGVGTIDADYRGEVGVILINLSNEYFTINPGDRIAQLVFNKVEQANLIEVDTLDETERGVGGFGHTGVK